MRNQCFSTKDCPAASSSVYTSVHPSPVCLSIHPETGLTWTSVATVTFPKSSRWCSHSYQYLDIPSVTREIPILTLPWQQSCGSRLFQWKGIPPSTQTSTHTVHTHTHTHFHHDVIWLNQSPSSGHANLTCHIVCWFNPLGSIKCDLIQAMQRRPSSLLYTHKHTHTHNLAKQKHFTSSN